MIFHRQRRSHGLGSNIVIGDALADAPIPSDLGHGGTPPVEQSQKEAPYLPASKIFSNILESFQHIHTAFQKY